MQQQTNDLQTLTHKTTSAGVTFLRECRVKAWVGWVQGHSAYRTQDLTRSQQGSCKPLPPPLLPHVNYYILHIYSSVTQPWNSLTIWSNHFPFITARAAVCDIVKRDKGQWCWKTTQTLHVFPLILLNQSQILAFPSVTWTRDCTHALNKDNRTKLVIRMKE